MVQHPVDAMLFICNSNPAGKALIPPVERAPHGSHCPQLLRSWLIGTPHLQVGFHKRGIQFVEQPRFFGRETEELEVAAKGMPWALRVACAIISGPRSDHSIAFLAFTWRVSGDALLLTMVSVVSESPVDVGPSTASFLSACQVCLGGTSSERIQTS